MRIQRAQGGRRFKQKLEEKEAKHVEELASLREELARLRPSEATSP
jgi:Skp family chaperone for outer membrane proteins